MIQATKNYFRFLSRCARIAFVGDWRYYAWMGFLTVFVLLGINAYCKQFVHGLIMTGMSDQVSWGVYISNFTFIVGIAAAAAMLVIPVYIYDNEELHDLVIFGELLAVASILMCLAFVTVDLGRPDRFWHLIPGIGKFNFPHSMLSWDVVVLNGYLLLNVYICGYLLYCRYRNRKPSKWFYVPFVFVAIVWAISIHTVTAFLYVGLGGRHFWNSAIVGPRFLASAFTAGPALIILALQITRRVTTDSGSFVGSLWRRAPNKPVLGTGRPATAEDLNHLAEHLPAITSVAMDIRKETLKDALVYDVPPGTFVIRQGERRDNAFCIIEGKVSVRRDEGGSNRDFGTLESGDVFGEIAALTGTPRTANVVTQKRTVLLSLPASSLRTLMRDPDINDIIRSKMTERLVITDRALLTLRGIVQVSMLINVFLLLNEVFKEFYSKSKNIASAQYLFFGLEGHHALVPWIWTAVIFNLIAMFLLILPLTKSLKYLNVACVLAIVGIWIEKGMGLVVPGFIPTPLGEIVEYSPSLNETLICLGIWSFGILAYTIFLRMSVPILQGKLSKESENVSLHDVIFPKETHSRAAAEVPLET